MNKIKNFKWLKLKNKIMILAIVVIFIQLKINNLNYLVSYKIIVKRFNKSKKIII